MAKIFLLISEGPTDFHVVEHLSAAIGKECGEEVKVLLLSPAPDATSGRMPSHGWGGVKAACERHRVKTDAELGNIDPRFKKLALALNWRNLLAFNGAAGLIIQLDADVAEDIDGRGAFDPTVHERRAFSESVLEKWIGQAPDGKSLYFAVTKMALETWLLATYDRGHDIFKDLQPGFSFGEIVDVENRLIALGCSAETAKSGRRRLKKKVSKYQRYGEQIAANLAKVRSECSCADALCDYLAS